MRAFHAEMFVSPFIPVSKALIKTPAKFLWLRLCRAKQICVQFLKSTCLGAGGVNEKKMHRLARCTLISTTVAFRRFWSLDHSQFEFVSDFMLRISNLPQFIELPPAPLLTVQSAP